MMRNNFCIDKVKFIYIRIISSGYEEVTQINIITAKAIQYRVIFSV